MNTINSPMVLLDIFVAPSTVFTRLQSIKKWGWLGLLLLITMTIFSTISFYGNMSPDWIMEQQLLHAGEIAPAERDATIDMMSQAVEYLGLIGSVLSTIFLVFVCALSAGYLMLVSKLSANKNNYQFGDWFSFSIWSQMPLFINLFGFIIIFLTSSTPDLPLELPNYASLNQLYLGLVPGDVFFNFAENINLFYLWSIGLVTLGLMYCCQFSITKAIFFSLLPYLVVFGLWFLLLI
ncbi:YIP1 family protein [Aliiglaciecola sp. LCG003]|uniref:YIP1 family protein n=1 Tax=Aliiglaciecola sp. LCG003 TaxID=3053655 RepID=UPI0025730452|nr:YIP1 family protein [Aliiglaciecola sp. LCG003]WJG11193.1 YIP1 family protein [Aliiglaciecola sp. LCG003]